MKMMSTLVKKYEYRYIMMNEESCDVINKNLLMCKWNIMFTINECWQNFMRYLVCALMVCQVWQERQEHERQEGIVIQDSIWVKNYGKWYPPNFILCLKSWL